MRLLRALVAAVTLLVALATPVRATMPEPASPGPFLDVPFLSQTEALCGGAAAAMVFRFWGDRHADVHPFAPLVDRRRGGIEAGRLADAIAARGWDVRVEAGSLATLSMHLERRQPVIVLIEDRPGRYHFVVVVGMTGERVVVHDPTWGPGRSWPSARFVTAWQSARGWSAVVRPPPGLMSTGSGAQAGTPGRSGSAVPDGTLAGSVTAASGVTAVAGTPGADACGRDVDAAVDAIQAQGLEVADRLLLDIRSRCPRSSRPVSELAGVRFAQQRYREAATLAEEAVAMDRGDRYGWDLLAASRFVLDDARAALAAWNAIGQPRLDRVRIQGLSRTRYALVAQWLRLEPGRLLTAREWALATRRAGLLPALSRATLRLVPEASSADAVRWAEVTLSVVEREVGLRRPQAWGAMAVRAAANREARFDWPGWSGQGDAWSGSWRWWHNRPRVALSYAAPVTGALRGAWRVDGAWTAQQFARGREEQFHGRVARTDWWSPAWRYELRAGVDRWRAGGRYTVTGSRLDGRGHGDRVGLQLELDRWWPLGSEVRPFTRAVAQASLRTALDDRDRITIGTAGVQAVTAAAPQLAWPLAGDVGGDSPLLRAHVLGRAGTIDRALFGRQLWHASVEQRQWFPRPRLARLGVAAFVDLAQAWHTDAGARRGPLAVDAGAGLRLRLPGQDSVIRIDVARDLRSGRQAVSVVVGR